jgi:hypothetical protein
MGRQEKIAKLESLLTRVQARAQEPRLRLVAAAQAVAPVAQQQVRVQPPAPVVQASPVPSARPSPVPAPAPASGRSSPVPQSGRATPLASAPAGHMRDVRDEGRGGPPAALAPDVIRAEFATGTVARFVGELRVQTLADMLREALKAS